MESTKLKSTFENIKDNIIISLLVNSKPFILVVLLTVSCSLLYTYRKEEYYIQILTILVTAIAISHFAVVIIYNIIFHKNYKSIVNEEKQLENEIYLAKNIGAILCFIVYIIEIITLYKLGYSIINCLSVLM